MNTLLFKCFGVNISLFLMSRFVFIIFKQGCIKLIKGIFCKCFTFKLSFFIKESLKQKVLFIFTVL